MDSACESPTGFFIIYDPRNLGGGQELEAATLYDIAPTLLALLDQPIPPRLRGRALIHS
jgi:arylsulfatase A-like enzyme